MNDDETIFEGNNLYTCFFHGIKLNYVNNQVSSTGNLKYINHYQAEHKIIEILTKLDQKFKQHKIDKNYITKLINFNQFVYHKYSVTFVGDNVGVYINPPDIKKIKPSPILVITDQQIQDSDSKYFSGAKIIGLGDCKKITKNFFKSSVTNSLECLTLIGFNDFDV